MAQFDIQRLVARSGAVQTDDLDWNLARKAGLTDAEVRILRYMSDTETHTILYMRDLLAGYTAKDPEITAFLSVWVYEELWHGRALDQLITSSGREIPRDHYANVTQSVSWREPLEAILSQAAAYSTPRFIATHMAWGAINELTADAAYKAIADRTKNPVLATLLNRIIKQERKHFSFYFHQAAKRLQGDRGAQLLCQVALRLFWTPVGSGIGQESDMEFMAHHLFGGDDIQALYDVEAKIQELPGLGWFNRLTHTSIKLAKIYQAKHLQQAAA